MLFFFNNCLSLVFVCSSNTRTDTISNTNFRIKILTFLCFGVYETKKIKWKTKTWKKIHLAAIGKQLVNNIETGNSKSSSSALWCYFEFDLAKIDGTD